ncbi:transmembrane protein 255B isoform X2 [Ailuropoda melanoleuca]|uniref:transmembrane protein 255B isoform X2 n=1 Tax=Ailuropoda melanoleuca TaxID=9646 RepID=UPI001494A46E|nr:transmembrane protein 255B isoform X2 [Ailuropoda melanoleuca]
MKPSEDAQTRVGTGFGGEPRWHRCLRQEGWSRENTDPHLPSWGSSWGVRYQVGGPLCRGAGGQGLLLLIVGTWRCGQGCAGAHKCPSGRTWRHQWKPFRWLVGEEGDPDFLPRERRVLAQGFARRKKTSLWFVGSLLVVSVSILTIGLAATTRTENVTVGGYYPGITLGFGAFLGIIGINLVENRRQMDPRPLTMGRCQFFASEAGYVHDAYQTEVTCPSLSGTCPLKHGTPPHLLRVRGRARLSGRASPLPAALGLGSAQRAGCAPGHLHGRRPGGLQGHGPPVPAGLRPVRSTPDPLQPRPADPGLRGLLPGTCDPPRLLVLPSASPGCFRADVRGCPSCGEGGTSEGDPGRAGRGHTGAPGPRPHCVSPAPFGRLDNVGRAWKTLEGKLHERHSQTSRLHAAGAALLPFYRLNGAAPHLGTLCIHM